MEIQVENISKSFSKGKIKALENINFSVKKGELFGLIGPDGAGKTTLFRILTTLLNPDIGTGSVAGLDIHQDYKKIRANIGYMPGKFSLYQDLSVEENLNFFATLFETSLSENYHLIKDIYSQLEPFKKRRAGALSGGMKQKLALCCALIHQPKVLFLDEPTTGVDTVSRKEFWEMLKNLQKVGITILVSTPYMDEASLCDRIALIQEGKILSINEPEGIISNYSKDLYQIKAESLSLLLKELRNYPQIDSCHSFGEYIHITLKGSTEELEKELAKKTIKGLSKIEKIKPTIEDCFINLMEN
ncbi:MAG: hypothetical protein RIR51_1717 [Bacteroidota bacterium]